MNKHLFSLIILLAALSSTAYGQLTIDDCQAKARNNYPLIKQYDLIAKSKEYSLSNAARAYLPQLQLNARATYQSEVTAIPISLPGVDIPQLSKDQYQVYLEVNQTLWDGGVVRSQKKITEAGADAENQQLQVDLYAVEARVNQLFFGILLLDAQLKQNQILLDELERNYVTVASYVENGIAHQADFDAIKVEQLNTQQNRIQIVSTRTAYLNMLSYMAGETIDSATALIKPNADEWLTASDVNRPELQWFASQNRLLESQKGLLKTAYMPKLNLFVQGGGGRPGLNMLSSDFDAYYIGGIRLAWNFGALYTLKNDLRKLSIQQQHTDARQETFLFNVHLEVIRENQDIKRLEEQMKLDDEIITLRENIRKAEAAKVANGTATVTDLMRELMRENLARQTKDTHEIDLLIAIYNIKYTTNN